ncbi:hypothetical protein CJ030_MR0G005177 [Morella rubra]|uniref:Uncharacterized protein n=1 Tax=Morella rubra TaxID=262757 RepID=A0A6A1UMM4_9ROSI|nr:hypothetical protein CJ030_MR0G005177 [Morella rubra]
MLRKKEMRIELTIFVLAVPLLCALSWLPLLNAQLPEISARSLDALLQHYAFRTFAVRPKTGIPIDTRLPSNLAGLQVSALRVRSGSLRTRGVHSYKEFQIPTGIVEQPYVKRVVLLYHNLGNLSSYFYPLPGFSYLAPVLGLLAYNASDLSASDLPELFIRASYQNPILIKFPNLSSSPDGLSPRCVHFDLHGSVQFDKMLSGNVCPTTQQGHFSVVVESTAPSPAPHTEPSARGVGVGGGREKSHNKEWIVLGSVVGGVALAAALALLVASLRRLRHKKKVQQMEWESSRGVTLRSTSIGDTKTPSAMGTRTRPVLEDEICDLG